MDVQAEDCCYRQASDRAWHAGGIAHLCHHPFPVPRSNVYFIDIPPLTVGSSFGMKRDRGIRQIAFKRDIGGGDVHALEVETGVVL